jgi:hypothetical protein
MRSLLPSFFLPASAVGLWILSASASGGSEFRTDFSQGLEPLQKSPTGTWEIQMEEGNAVAALVEAGSQPGGVRRPTGYLLLPQFDWSDVSISMRARTLEPAEVINRDFVVIFGYVDPTHFYYTHLSSNSDDKNHNIIKKVSGDTRSNIHQQVLPEARVTDDWHDVRVTHDRSGAIAVYVDDMDVPLMTAQDSDYAAGAIGIGSFDDRALFDDLVVSGAAIERVTPRMINISTRGTVLTGSGIMIAGFVVDGAEPETVLLRAAGPALTALGVTGALEDPTIELVSAETGLTLETNDNWSEAPNAVDIALAANQVGAFAFAENSPDSALLVDLSPGVYTVKVIGREEGTGVSLVEAYAVENP